MNTNPSIAPHPSVVPVSALSQRSGITLEAHHLRHVILEHTDATLRGFAWRNKTGLRERCLLDISELRVQAGESLALTGPSGCGKTTLLHVLAGLLPPVSVMPNKTGRKDQSEQDKRPVPLISWNGQNLYALPEVQRDRLRAGLSGMIFQDFQLLDGLSALDNVLLPHTFRRFSPPPEAREQALVLLETLGIGNPATRTERLSRGEMQRVALARALCRPSEDATADSFRTCTGACGGLLFADEPTANLDALNARQVAETLREICRIRGTTLVCATHDPYLMHCLDHRVHLENGQLRVPSEVLA